MSEALEKVRGVKRLPLFPLSVVLLPDEILPLHIFEPRYRQMLRDIRLEKNMFGVSFFDASKAISDKPEIRSLGCVAEVREAQTMKDGRSNILTVGVIRYRLESYVQTDEPYLVAEVSFFEDEPESPEKTQVLADEVFALFKRMAQAAHDISGQRGRLADIPQAPPDRLSFLIAAAFNFDLNLKYELLEMRSTAERLSRLRNYLKQSVEKIEESAEISKVAKTNGHSKKKIEL